MRVPGDVLVVVVVFAEVDAPDHARLHEEVERAVDGGAGDLDLLVLHLREELVRLEVIMRGEDLTHEGYALGRQFEPLFPEKALKSFDLALDGRHSGLAFN